MRGTVSIQDTTPGLLVLAVDDEAHGLDELTYLLGQNSQVGRVIGAYDAAEALRVIRGADPETKQRLDRGLCPVDAVFADISMPGLSGLELAQVINAFRDKPQLVFVTGLSEEAVTAFELGALDYIVKPPQQARVDMAIDRVAKFRLLTAAPPTPVGGVVEQAGDDEVIPVELAGTTKLVPRSTVRYVEAQGDYARLHTAEGSHLVRIPLAQLEERWADAGFIRIHRSFLVSLPLVTELRMGSSGYTVVVGAGSDEKELPVSRRHTRELKDRLVRQPKHGWGAGT
ncbi:LytTR family DNA-binding domain-containing protein [Kutzneria sp. 744]|uniref:LytR/AlgR family response regulator transcription factor n=1 Tax=Kutzneria sp. (strain 744) TaxID=345341 RepID=UPI0009FC4E5E|nr:LytTR family DNA-binding domain-containing protein [Kutzneria sp. 744]